MQAKIEAPKPRTFGALHFLSREFMRPGVQIPRMRITTRQSITDEAAGMSDQKFYYAPYFSTDPIPGGHEVASANDYREAQSELAALREELAVAHGDNSDMAEVLTFKSLSLIRAGKQLADAEQRNVRLIELLKSIQTTWNVPDPSDADHACWAAIESALNPKPEASSHEN